MPSSVFNNCLERKLTSPTNSFENALINLAKKIQEFIEKYFDKFLFILCTAFTFRHAFLRVSFAAAITFLTIGGSAKSSKDPVISSTDEILSIIGALGLILHRILFPFSNPLFYFSPILNGIAFSHSLIKLYQ